MKYIFIASFFILLQNTSFGQEKRLKFFDLNVNSLNLDQYKGKKMLLIEGSIFTDKKELLTLDSFILKYKEQVNLILLFPDSLHSAFLKIQDLYSSKGVIVALNKQNRSDTISLNDWLTGKKLNGHFNFPVIRKGYRFAISGTGELVAVFPAFAKLDSPLLAKFLADNKPNE